MKKQIKNKKSKPISIFDSNEFNMAALGLDLSGLSVPDLKTETANANLQMLRDLNDGKYDTIKNTTTDIGSIAMKGLGATKGVMQLGSQALSNLSTEGIGSEVEDINDISRGDILNTTVKVDSNKTNTLGQAASGALTGAQAGMAFGPLGAGVGAGIGLLAGGLSSIFGNKAKEKAAHRAEQQWVNNLQAKDRQFQFQDLRNQMANYSAYGGDIFAYGGQFDKSLIEFNEGGTHEENPNQGIMQGTGQNGKPNLVEEGETRHEDYIFSDRLKLDKLMVESHNLPKNLIGKTFADASKSLNKEAKERPNDPISQKGIKANMAILTETQEALKQQNEYDEKDNQAINMLGEGESIFAKGGKIYIKPSKR